MRAALLLCAVLLCPPEEEPPPDLDDLLRLPSRETVAEFVAFNRAYREWLQGEIAFAEAYRPGDYTHHETMREALACFAVPDALDDAHRDSNSECYRRGRLARVRELAGPAAYYSGCLVPHVPTWRMQRRD